MKKHLNTLYVTTQGAYLSKEGETVMVSIEGEKRVQVPVHTIGGIVCFGRVMCSPFLMGLCAERGAQFFNPKEDCLRFYYLGSNWEKRVEHIGAKPAFDQEGPLTICCFGLWAFFSERSRNGDRNFRIYS